MPTIVTVFLICLFLPYIEAINVFQRRSATKGKDKLIAQSLDGSTILPNSVQGYVNDNSNNHLYHILTKRAAKQSKSAEETKEPCTVINRVRRLYMTVLSPVTAFRTAGRL